MLALDDDDLRDAISRLAIAPRVARRYLLGDVIRRNFKALATAAHMCPPLEFAYSVKTNPERALLDAARDAGLYAEVISPQELELAHESGFGHKTIYNGPSPAWKAAATPWAAFADSLEAFEQNARTLPDTLAGLRVRPAGIPSRFGVEAHRAHDAAAAIRASGRRSIGISFHARPQDYGPQSWREIVSNVLEVAQQIERITRARVVAFNVGGGKTPLEFDRSVAGGDLAWLIRTTANALPAVASIFAEPGQAVATPCGIYVAPVLEWRANEVVVAAGYPELPQIRTFAHRIFVVFGSGEIRLLPPGKDRILGRTCLEYDIIRDGICLPSPREDVQAFVVGDCGAYDYSMAFDFAQGGNREPDELGVP